MVGSWSLKRDEGKTVVQKFLLVQSPLNLSCVFNVSLFLQVILSHKLKLYPSTIMYKIPWENLFNSTNYLLSTTEV